MCTRMSWNYELPCLASRYLLVSASRILFYYTRFQEMLFRELLEFLIRGYRCFHTFLFLFDRYIIQVPRLFTVVSRFWWVCCFTNICLLLINDRTVCNRIYLFNRRFPEMSKFYLLNRYSAIQSVSIANCIACTIMGIKNICTVGLL